MSHAATRSLPVLSLVAGLVLAPAALAGPDPTDNPKKAIKKYSRAVEKSPDDPNNWYNLALAHALLEEWDAAVPASERAVTLAPESAPFQYLHGRALKGAGQADAAVAAYERAVELDPGMLEAQAELADAYYAAGRWDDAIAAYKDALRTKPDSPAVFYNGLGNAYVKKGDFTQATRWFERTIEAAPNDPITWYNVGAIYLALSREEDSFAAKAADAFAKAAELGPRDPDNLYMAGETAFKAQRYDVARQHFEAFLKLESSGERAELAKIFLAEL